MIDYHTHHRHSWVSKAERRASMFRRMKPAAILLLIFIAYGIVGRIDCESQPACSQQIATAQPQVVLVASAK